MADLFDLGDLPSWLQVPEVDEQTAIRVRRAANGWLQDATSLTEWPNPLPDRLWAWAIELAAIAYRNPAAAASGRIDDFEYVADRARRTQILDDARRAYPAATTGPQWSFPKPDWSWSGREVGC
ncbi:hypothetical protein [Micromonospora chersina]|uniref:hypothetical protein n=1 Tax=Micromonospora chersina TaxID=47854 RepID=UPI0033C97235